MIHDRTCPECGAAFYPLSNRQACCSGACQRQRSVKMMAKRRELIRARDNCCQIFAFLLELVCAHFVFLLVGWWWLKPIGDAVKTLPLLGLRKLEVLARRLDVRMS